MNKVTALILVLSSITATFGTMQLVFWFVDRKRVERLAFFMACFGAVCFALLEIGMAHSATPDEYLFFHRLANPFSTLTIIGTAWFLYTSLGTGRKWLFLSVVFLRLAVLVIHLVLPNGINWQEVTAMVPVTFLGERMFYAEGVPTSVNVVPTFSFLLLLVFSLDTSIRAWRTGDRIRVIIHGFGVALFALATPGLAAGILLGFLQGPVFVAPTILFVIMAMSFQMLLDMQKAATLSDSLKESEAKLKDTLDQLHLSAEAGDVGLWKRSFDDPVFWASEKAKELFGFESDAQIGPREFLEHVHDNDRERVITAMKEIEKDADEFDIEFRVIRPGGEVAWIHSHGDIIRGETMLVRGASVDITKRKVAEEHVHELARKLINAQEKERARLACDLHDHLSQSIALLSIQLSGIKKRTFEPQQLESKVDELTSQLRIVGSDVHRMSHELHPAKLRQLGLEAALAGFCREIAAAHGITVNFTATDLPKNLDDELAICFYRVAQEGLQNIVKHSNANNADVKIAFRANELLLEVSDDGDGFDVESGREKGSLGLVSISERMWAVSGESRIISAPSKGTRIEARAPIQMSASGPQDA